MGLPSFSPRNTMKAGHKVRRPSPLLRRPTRLVAFWLKHHRLIKLGHHGALLLVARWP